jgi:hypothetical protein
MARVAPSLAVIVVLGSLARPARADLPGGAQINVLELQIFRDGGFSPSSDPEEEARYFNFAHCTCSAEVRGMETEFRLKLELQMHTQQIDEPLELWLGDFCDDNLQRPNTCVLAQTIADIDTLAIGPETVPFNTAETLSDNPNTVACPDREGEASVWTLVDVGGDGMYDDVGQLKIPFDTQAPPSPANPVADPGENAVLVTWEAPVSRAEDVLHYQALCARADTGAPAFVPPTDTPRYQTASQLCGSTNGGVTLLPIAVGAKPLPGPTPDAPPPDAALPDAAPPAPDAAPPIDVPAGLTQLDPAFICGSTGGGATEIRIEGLENGVDYFVAVVAIDFSGNLAGVVFTSSLTPQPVTDFWEDLHDDGSEVEGGFCLISTTFGGGGWLAEALRGFRDATLAKTAFGRGLTRAFYAVSDAVAPVIEGSIVLRILAGILLAPFIVLALLWHALGLPVLVGLAVLAVWLRRRRRSARALRLARIAAATAIVVGLAASASAQSSNDPYWSDPYVSGEEEGYDIAEPHWHVGLRVGPYTPGIDAQLGGADPGPYERMFGGYAIMPVLDVDWLFLRRFGQLGVGGSIGFMGKTANAFEATADPMDPDPPRSDGDETTFRLLPIAITAVYRLTYLDDRFGVPIIPYVRGGLSYYLWWSGAPNGNTSVVLTPEGCSPSMDGCDVNRARGASLGVQGSIGLAIRAERVDKDAARSMRDGGVEHAGFYAELQMAKVDGFGNEKKLSVGDTTWFAGVDFEF